MAYSDFSLEQLEEEFGIRNQVQIFSELESAKPVKDVSHWLKKSLSIARELPVKSEKARSELIVTPILIELREMNDKFFTYYSGDNLNADIERGLRGECDFIIAKDVKTFNISLPIFSVVEAKRSDISIGIPQCAAQLLGAKIFNNKKGKSLKIIYGCVTTGDNWQSLKLENDTIFIDLNKYYLGDLEELLGVFQAILNKYK
ncbi:MAG: hypothetical protein ACPG19_05725 [Saprospiraceae bacterium]